MSSRIEISKLILSMRHYPNSPITDESVKTVIDSFDDTLSDLPFETVEAAVRQYKSTETFFPTPGKLREIAMDLQMLAMGVPTPTEAWGIVIGAIVHKDKTLCRIGYDLYNTDPKSVEYIGNIFKYSAHIKACAICDIGGWVEDYKHPIVEATVKALGGRDVIITDNPTSDRARFIDAYREIVARERRKAAMLPEVKAYIAETKTNMIEAGSQIKQLTKGMTK